MTIHKPEVKKILLQKKNSNLYYTKQNVVSEDEHEHRVWKMSAVDPGCGKESPPPPILRNTVSSESSFQKRSMKVAIALQENNNIT